MRQILKLFLFALVIAITSCSETDYITKTDYAITTNWYELPKDTAVTEADIFYVYPTVAMMTYKENHNNWNTTIPHDYNVMKEANSNQRFNKMLYAGYRFYAPYYRQAILSLYEQPQSVQNKAFAIATADIKAAFQEYMEKYNNGRPFFLIGHSQGSQMLLELLKSGMTNEQYRSMVAAYLIGYSITENDLATCPERIKPAEGAEDKGKVIVINSITKPRALATILPKTIVGINPITWTTDTTHTDKSQHLGLAKYNDNRTAIVFEEHLTGGYLKDHYMVCTDLPDDYCFIPTYANMFPLGNLHFTDSFLYGKNIVENMKVRLAAMQNKTATKHITRSHQ